MTVSLGEYVRAIQRQLPPALVDAEAVTAIVALADMLPAHRLAGFECRLGAEEPTVDFQVQLPPGGFAVPLAFAERQAWTFLSELCEAWRADRSVLQRAVDAMGLEFDGADPTAPSVFASVKRAGAQWRALLPDVIRRLSPGSTPGREATLASCLVHVPDAASIGFVGTMLGRASCPVRLNVSGLTPADLTSFLLAIDWPGEIVAAASLAADLAELTDSLIVCLDVADVVLPVLGLECVLREQPSREPRWAALLDRLEARGLCTPAKRSALLGWPGHTLREDAGGDWPTNLDWGDRLLGADAVSSFYRYVSHLKVVHHTDRLDAKAYLGFSHQWTDAAAIQTRVDCDVSRSG